MRPRRAPSAQRTASSLCRAVPRASIRLATFTQAMIRTNPTAPSSTSSICSHPAEELVAKGSDPGAAFAHVAWIRPVDAGGERVHFRPCLLDRDARRQPCDDEIDRPLRAIVHDLGARELRDRCPHNRAVDDAAEPRRHDADDRAHAPRPP